MATGNPAMSRNAIAYIVGGVVVLLLAVWWSMAAGDDVVVEGAGAEAVVAD